MLAFVLAAELALAAPLSLFAATPTLSLQCGIPNQQDIVTCRLSGRGFHPLERLQISYLLTFTALPRRHGRLPQTSYRRVATSDRAGAFTRPPLGFAVVRYHESFRLTVSVVGARGDRTTTTTVAIAQ
jgi:hypothetical protein